MHTLNARKKSLVLKPFEIGIIILVVAMRNLVDGTASLLLAITGVDLALAGARGIPLRQNGSYVAGVA